MGYDFSFERPAKGAAGLYRLNVSQMAIVREVLREVGAVDEKGSKRALALKGFEPTSESAPMAKFRSNDGWHVTPEECRFIAARVRKGLGAGVPAELLSFYDDAPPTKTVVAWLEEFAAFNERAAEHGGYRVR